MASDPRLLSSRALPRGGVATVTLSCLLLTSCDVLRGVRRRAPAPPSFDPVVAETLLRRHPHFVADEAIAWDGHTMWCPFRDGPAVAAFGYTAFEEHGGRGIWVDSVWVGRPPSTDLLRSSLRLQNAVLAVLATWFQDLPPTSAFTTEWVNIAPLPADDFADAEIPWRLPKVDETWRLAIHADALPNWRLGNANGEAAQTNALRVVTGQTVQLLLLADRECSLEIPALGIRLLTVPDRYQTAFFTVLEPAEYDVLVRSGSERYDGKLIAVAPDAR
jgi:hypothetical protein